jgi:type I restriction enzyme S subunit
METALKEKLSIDKSDWTPVKFGDIAFEPKETAKDIYNEGIEHVVGLEHIESENIHLTRSGTLEESTTFSKIFKKGDVLFGRRRAYLKKAVVARFEGICSGDITVFRARKNILPELLPFIVHNEKFFEYAIKHSAGGLSPRVKFKDLANYEFLLPPKDQQAQLAELLWAMDEVIERENSVLTELTNLNDGGIEELLEGKVQLKLENGFSKLLKSDSIKNEWEMFSIGELCHKVTDGEHLSPKFLEKGKPILSAKDIRENDIQIENANFISEEAFNVSRKRCDPDFNDVLIVSRGATIGRTTVNKLKISFALMGSVILLKPNDKILGDYLCMIIRRKKYQRRLLAISGSTAQQAIYLVDIKKSKVLIPDRNYQIKVVDFMKEISDRIYQVKLKHRNSQSLQKSLINQIF